MSGIYTYYDLLDDLSKRQIPINHELVKKLRDILREYIDPEKVDLFYGKNLFKDGEKLLYFFSEKRIVEVKIFEKNIKFRVIKNEIVDVEYSYPLYQDSHAHLKLTFDNGDSLEFNSKEDSNVYWNSTYVEAIKVIFMTLL